jgi:hypothetical protein
MHRPPPRDGLVFNSRPPTAPYRWAEFDSQRGGFGGVIGMVEAILTKWCPGVRCYLDRKRGLDVAG